MICFSAFPCILSLFALTFSLFAAPFDDLYGGNNTIDQQRKQPGRDHRATATLSMEMQFFAPTAFLLCSLERSECNNSSPTADDKEEALVYQPCNKWRRKRGEQKRKRRDRRLCALEAVFRIIDRQSNSS